MRKVTIKKSALVEIVKKNRDQHRAAYEKAFEGYRKECHEVLEKNLLALATNKRHIVRFGEQPPEDHTEDYDRVLLMLDLSTDDNIELLSEEFQNYVQDNWNWKARWQASNAGYTSKA